MNQNCANTALSFVAEYPVPSGMVSQGTAIPLLIYDSKKCQFCDFVDSEEASEIS